MRTVTRLLVVATSAALAACGSSSSQSSSNTSAAAGTVVQTAANAKLGSILVDVHGMTLYSLSAERNGHFICTGACLQAWHPLSPPSGSAPAGATSLGTIKRPDGSSQVTFKGLPLYTFAQDHNPGDANGQGIKDVGTWSAARSTGAPAATSPAPTTSTSSPTPYRTY